MTKDAEEKKVGFHAFGNAKDGWSCSFTDDGSHLGFGIDSCPFCGEHSSLELTNTHTPSYHVECHGCGAVGPTGYPDAGFPTRRYRTKEKCLQAHNEAAIDAISGWNR